MLNIGSLILGVGAWLLATLAITARKGITSHRNTMLSFGFCAMSLVLQLFEINRRVLLGDYAGIEDTIRAIIIASAALAGITIFFNVVAWRKAKNK